jgi:O-6-methylguanine DNA methyltransferase
MIARVFLLYLQIRFDTFKMKKYYKIEYCYIGFVLVVSNDKGIISVDINDNIKPLLKSIEKRYGDAVGIFYNPDVESWIESTFDFIEYPLTSSYKSIPVELNGTKYQNRVYKVLMELDVGELITYSGLAEKIGDVKSSSSVASAVASNEIAFLVPCHRVINKSGTFVKYKWGSEKKNMILKKEAVV